VLSGLSLTIYKGEVTAIVGHNGSGKSMLLKILNGLGAIDAGNRQETQGSFSLQL
jgi:ABC-type polysaccharide/polyol phosphate transport system ATPase subunit